MSSRGILAAITIVTCLSLAPSAMAQTGACCNFNGHFCFITTGGQAGCDAILPNNTMFLAGLTCDDCNPGAVRGACCDTVIIKTIPCVVTITHAGIPAETYCPTFLGGNYRGDGTDCFQPGNFCPAVECGDLDAGDCFAANGTPFCDDADCCNLVCTGTGIPGLCEFGDPFCCATNWDAFCAGPNTAVPGCSAVEICTVRACCFPDAPCQDLAAPDCIIAGGTPQPDGTDCLSVDCDGDGIPDADDICPNNTPGLPVACDGRPLRDCNGDCLFDGDDIQCIVDEMLNQ